MFIINLTNTLNDVKENMNMIWRKLKDSIWKKKEIELLRDEKYNIKFKIYCMGLTEA